ncbi:MAG: MbnP family protein [Chloroherpetonaceae bacterium]
MKKLFLSLALLVFFASACKEESNSVTPTDETVSFKLLIEGKFDTLSFALNRPFVNQAGDTVRFTMAKFYLSEVCLVDTLGRTIPVRVVDTANTTTIDNQTVTLLDYATAQNGVLELTLRAKPGLYRGMKFNVGVPFNLNHRDASVLPKPLNIDQGMFWTWNTGYIFHRIEGNFDSLGTSRNFLYHIGGDNRNLTVQLATLTGSNVTRFEVAANGSSVFRAKMDYRRLFATGLTPPNPIHLRQNSNERTAHGGALADRVFLNTQTMFSRITN